jgi:hypothetical protein
MNPAVYRALPTLEYLQNAWEMFLSLKRFKPVKEGLLKGLENLRKCFNKTDDSKVYFVCLSM